jgi:hypothetical protein
MPPSSSQSQPTAKTPALLVDGSALFFGQRAVSPDKNLDYVVLQELIQRHTAPHWPPRPAHFFTAADDSNEKQAKFHQMISNQLGWTIRQVPPPEAITANALLSDASCRIIRFDALIGYALGRLGGRPEISRIFIISDAWPLQACIKDCIARGTPVTMCFFGDVIDQRWHRVFRETDPAKLEFLDLEREPRLFNRPRLLRRKEEDVLDLP